MEGRWVLRQTESKAAPRETAPDDSQERVYANLYLIAVGQGNAPALEAFMSEVPEEMRDRVFDLLDRALANPDQAPETVPSPVRPPRPDATPLPESASVRVDAPIVALPKERLLRAVGLLVPSWMREDFLGSLAAQRQTMRQEGATPRKILFVTAKELASGLAQRAPLCWPPEANSKDEKDPVSIVGRAAWRLSGPLLLSGHLFGMGTLLLLGVLAVGTSLGCVLKATLSKGWEHSADRVRLVNGVLGSLVVILSSALLLAAPAAALLLLASLVSFGWLAGAAVHLFVFGLLAVSAVVSASGWAPPPWTTKHLVRVKLR